MELLLGGGNITATELERVGLVNRTFPKGQVLSEAKSFAAKIAEFSGPVARAAKQAVLAGEFVTPLLLHTRLLHLVSTR